MTDLSNYRQFVEKVQARIAEQAAAPAPELSVSALDGNTLSGDTRTGMIKLRERWREMAMTAQQIRAELVMIRRGQTEVLTALNAVASIAGQLTTRMEAFERELDGPPGSKEEGVLDRVSRLEKARYGDKKSRAAVAKTVAKFATVAGLIFASLGWLSDHWPAISRIVGLLTGH
jgi:hypothetical protein